MLTQIAQPVIQALAALPAVKGILCFGSYAQGTADAASDIDLYVLCAPDIPPLAVRRGVLLSTPGLETLDMNHRELGWDTAWCPQTDRLLVDHLWFDNSYNTLDFVETVVRKVRRGATSIPEMRFRPYTLLGLLENGRTLYDPQGRLELLRQKLAPFPPRLRQRLLAENLQFAENALVDMEDITRRQIGSRAFHFLMGRCLDAVEELLFALNERYPQADKRVELALQALPVLPVDFSCRYQQLLETPLTGPGKDWIIQELRRLLGEIKKLPHPTSAS
jgi:hypothetical protein